MGRPLFLVVPIIISVALVIGSLIPFAESSGTVIATIGLLCIVPFFLIATCVGNNPKYFWPLLIISCIATSGLMIHGFTIVDEYFLASLLLGSFASMRPHAEEYIGGKRLHRVVFLLLVGYMLIQCFHGMFILESPRKLRWVVYFLMVGLLALVLTDKRPKVPPVRNLALVITLTTLVYLCVYIGYGVISESLGINRYDLQYAQISKGVNVGAIAIWGTTAYTLFPVAVAMPAIFILLRDKQRFFRRSAWITLVVAVIAAFYYDSRVSLLTIMAFVVGSFFSMGLRRALTTLFVLVIIFFAFFSFIWEDWRKSPDVILEDLFGFVGTTTAPEGSSGVGSDLGRSLLIKVAFISISGDWKHFLFGYGYRRGGTVIAPHLNNLFLSYGIKYALLSDSESAEAFTNIVVDTGMVGLTLLALNFFLVAGQILRQKSNPNRIFLLLSLSIIGFWLFVIDILDVVLFFLAIMPSGVLVQLSRYEISPISRNSDLPEGLRSVLAKNAKDAPYIL